MGVCSEYNDSPPESQGGSGFDMGDLVKIVITLAGLALIAKGCVVGCNYLNNMEKNINEGQHHHSQIEYLQAPNFFERAYYS